MTITISIRDNGPYVIAPDQASEIRLIDHAGNPVPLRAAAGQPTTLCRCGASSTKPFCDGTHSRIGFIGAEAARAAFDAAQAALTTAEDGAGGPVAQGDGAETGTLPPTTTER